MPKIDGAEGDGTLQGRQGSKIVRKEMAMRSKQATVPRAEVEDDGLQGIDSR